MMQRDSGWVEASKRQNSPLFSELDVLLRALDRFSNLQYLPASRELISGKNFAPELEAARHAVLRIIGILEAVIPEGSRNAFWFQKFAEAKLLTDRRRERFREEMYLQASPEKALYLLYDSFINLKTLLADLLRNEEIGYMSFKNIGQIMSKQVRENRYFNPFRHQVDRELDIIGNREISELVRGLGDRELKKTLSTLFVHLFRFLRYLRHMHFSTYRMVSLHASLLILMLLWSEINLLRVNLEKAASRLLSLDLVAELEALSYQYSMESKRVFLQELKGVFEKKSPGQLRGRIENSHGILKNLTEQGIIQIARFLKPGLTGEEVFEVFITKTAQSLKLREDISALHRLLGMLEEGGNAPERRQEVLNPLLNYMEYFESFTFRLLRYDDYEEFISFFNDIRAAGRNGAGFDTLLNISRRFRIFLETTLRHIGNRAELKNRPIDVDNVEDLIRQYISTS